MSLEGAFMITSRVKLVGRGTAVAEDAGELLQLLGVGQVAEEEEVGDLLKPKLVGAQAADEVFDVVPPVEQLALAGHPLAVHILEGDDLGDVGQAVRTPHAVDVPKPLVHAVLPEEGVGDEVVLLSTGPAGRWRRFLRCVCSWFVPHFLGFLP